MTTREPIDPIRYVRMFPLDVPKTVSLIIRLMGVVPRSKSARDKDELARIRPAATAMRDSGVHLQQVWTIREQQGTTKLRPLDIAWDAAWSAVLSRIEPWQIFEGYSRHAESAKKAADLTALLFQNRLDFTRLELNAQWAEGKKRHDLIEAGKHRPVLVDLVGEVFVARLEETHEALGRALGLLGEPANPDLPLVADLAGALRSAHQAIAAYALQLVAAYPTASDDLAAQIHQALAALDSFRPSPSTTARAAEGGDVVAGPPQPGPTPDPAPVTDGPAEPDPSSPIPPLVED